MNTLINFDFQMPVRIHQRSHARLNGKNSEKRKQTVSVNSQNLRKCELKIDLLTEVLYELVKMFFARIQLTGGPDKHSMSQSERIYRFDTRWSVAKAFAPRRFLNLIFGSQTKSLYFK